MQRHQLSAPEEAEIAVPQRAERRRPLPGVTEEAKCGLFFQRRWRGGSGCLSYRGLFTTHYCAI